MSWSVWVVDTVTGVKIQRLPVAAFPWSRALNGGRSATATISLSSTFVELPDGTTTKLDLRDLTTPARNTLVISSEHGLAFGVKPVAIYAGIITGRTYNHTAGTLTVDTSDIWWVLARRLAIDHNSPTLWTTVQTYTAASLGTIAKGMVNLGTEGPANANLLLRITRPADEVGTIDRKFYGYHLNMVADVLADIINEKGGPDIDFAPRWVNDELDLLMRVGTVANPKLTAGSYEWNLGAEQSGIIGLTVKEDASKLASSSVGKGEGMESRGLYRSDRVVDPGFPALERVSTYSTESNALALAAKVDGDVAAFKQPTEQWGFSILAGGTPAVTDLLLGGRAKVWAESDPWIPDGWSSIRLVGFSGDLTDTVALEFQPERAA